MSTSDKKFAPAYTYDALDRLTTTSTAQRFYNSTRIATEIEGTVKRSFFEYDTQPLAQQQAGTTTLLATDEQTSVLHSISPAQSAPHAYSPYGHHPVANGLLSVLGFNGERPDPITGHYLLGQGYRAFNPVLMRFNSPDSFSPFGDGGINAYAYCAGDPINSSDPTGHWRLTKFLRNLFKSGKSANKPNNVVTAISFKTTINELNNQASIVKSPRTGAKSSSAHNNSMLDASKLFSEELHYRNLIKKANEELINLSSKEKTLAEKFTANDYTLNNIRGFMKNSSDEVIESALQEKSQLNEANYKLQKQKRAINRRINRYHQEINDLYKPTNIRKNQ